MYRCGLVLSRRLKEAGICQFLIMLMVRFLTGRVKWPRYRLGVPQRVGRGIALLFNDCGTRGGWMVSSTPRPHFTPGKDPVPILQEARWAPGPVWTGGKTRPHRDSIPGRPARSQSLYRLSYPAHTKRVRHEKCDMVADQWSSISECLWNP